MPATQRGPVCNFYKDNPYTEGAFKVALREQGGAPDVQYTVAAVDGTFNADGTPTSTHGQVITGEDYATRYGQAEPNMCQGADLTACMDETLEFDTP